MGTKTIKVIFDANVFVSFFITHGPTIEAILQGWEQDRFTVYASDEIIAEVWRVFEYVKIRQKLFSESKQILTTMFRIKVKRVKHEKQILFTRDPQDASYLETAVASNASYIVTGDKVLLTLKKIDTTRIVSPREFVDLLKE